MVHQCVGHDIINQMDDDHPPSLTRRATAAIDSLRTVDGMLARRHRDVGHALLLEVEATIQGLADALTGTDGPAL